MTIETAKYIYVDAVNNNNKFWEYSYDTNTSQFTVTFGRVGAAGSTEPAKSMTRKQLESKIREKEKKGYKKIEIVTDMPTTAKAATNITIKEAAINQLAKGNTALNALVTRLVDANRHELYEASGGQMNISLDTGVVSTPLGVVTKDNINSARNILNNLSTYVENKDFDNSIFMRSLSDYLMLVPQKVSSRRGWHREVIGDIMGLQKQNTMLDQMETSVDMAVAQIAAARAEKQGETPNLFDTTIQIVEDGMVIDRITKFFLSTLNNSHTSRNLRPVRVYEVNHTKMEAGWKNDGAKMSNIWQLWHGTRVFNVLSILKNGLIVPKSGGSYHVTGRMFGDGLYFSDQSTKSLNYSQGYWDGGPRDNNCFMFLFDVAMGNYHVPRSSNSQLHKYGHDSVFAKAGQSGVQNNEMIVYRLSQSVPRYLIEFSDKK